MAAKPKQKPECKRTCRSSPYRLVFWSSEKNKENNKMYMWMAKEKLYCIAIDRDKVIIIKMVSLICPKS